MNRFIVGLRRLFILSLFLWLVNFSILFPVSQDNNPYNVKANIITRFPRYIEWPASSSLRDKQQPFIIGIVGNNPIVKYLRELQDKIAIKGKQLKILEVKHYQNLRNCHMVFISKTINRELTTILKTLGNLPIVTIGDTEGYTKKGVMIDLFLSGNKFNFNVNKTSALKSQLKFTSGLLRYAKSIIE